jgi:hypothetical protein
MVISGGVLQLASSMPLTPLCPAGHLPHKEGDQRAAASRPPLMFRLKRCQHAQPISPPEGEMSGRTEGG